MFTINSSISTLNLGMCDKKILSDATWPSHCFQKMTFFGVHIRTCLRTPAHRMYGSISDAKNTLVKIP